MGTLRHVKATRNEHGSTKDAFLVVGVTELPTDQTELNKLKSRIKAALKKAGHFEPATDQFYLATGRKNHNRVYATVTFIAEAEITALRREALDECPHIDEVYDAHRNR